MATQFEAARHLLRIRDVMARTGLDRSAIYRKARVGEFPKPIKISERSSAWDSEAVDNWIAERIAASKKVA